MRIAAGLIPLFMIMVTSCAPKSEMEIALEAYMREAVDAWRFQGSVLAVVHDQYFVERFATRIWAIHDQAIRSYVDLDDMRRGLARPVRDHPDT